jgi:hypothetical protein
MVYAVVWSENDGPVYAGRLDVGPRSLRLAGSASEARRSRRQLFYRELTDVHVERRSQARLAGRPTLAFELPGGRLLRIASIDGAGSLHELDELVAAARAKVAA